MKVRKAYTFSTYAAVSRDTERGALGATQRDDVVLEKYVTFPVEDVNVDKSMSTPGDYSGKHIRYITPEGDFFGDRLVNFESDFEEYDFDTDAEVVPFEEPDFDIDAEVMIQ